MKKKKQTRLHHKIQHHAQLALVPHRKNHYRPHLIRRYGLLSVLLVIGVLLGGYNLSTTGSVLGDRAAISPSGLLSATNQVRSTYSIAPLTLNDALTQAAHMKVQDMFRQQYWAHVAPDGTQPWQWLDKAGYVYIDAGENLAKNFTTDESVVAAWMNSEAHRKNVLGNNFTQVGFSTMNGTLHGKHAQITVALYAKPATDRAVAGVTATKHFSEPPISQPSIIARMGHTLQAMSPAVLASFILLLITAFTAFAAHTYRNKLPRDLRRSWYRHHGLYKGVGMALLLIVIVALYSGGQI